MKLPRGGRIVAVGLALSTGGCVGLIGEHGATSPSPTAPATPGAPLAPEVAALPPALVPRLTRGQYVNTVRDVLGDAAATAAASLATEPIGDNDHRFRTERAAQSGFVDLGYENLDATAQAAARAVFDDDATRARVVGCPTATAAAPPAPHDACVQDFVARTARLFYRRPLSADETAAYGALVDAVTSAEMGNTWRGLEAALSAILQSPNFVYRPDLGAPEPAGPAGRVRFSGYELAARLAALLWDANPDAALLDAASRGELDTPAGMRAQATRLLADARAARGIGAYGTDLFEADRLDDVAKDATAFPAWGPALVADLREEIARTVADLVLARDADAMDLFTSRVTFINEPLARLYGIDGVTGPEFRRYTIADNWMRLGALGFGGFLAGHARSTNGRAGTPIARGVFLNQRVMCRTLGHPPPEAMAAVMSAAGQTAGEMRLTTRQLTERVTSPTTCAACHALINPLGFGLENFDAIGAFRPDEGGLPIDASGQLGDARFATPVEMARAIHDDPAAQACVAEQLYRYATGHLPDAAERPAIAALTARYQSAGRRVRALLVELVASDAFRYGRAPQ